MSIRYDPKSRDFIADTSPRYFASLDREVHDRDPSLGHTMAAGPDLLAAAKASLLVLCALLSERGKAMHPNMVKDVEFAIEANRVAIAKATAP